MERDRKKVAIGQIGLGNWGKNILRNLREFGVLRLACDLDPDVIAELKKEFPNVDYTSKADAIWKDPAIQAVAIATSAPTHYDLAKKSLAAGKDVFIEKPLSLRVDEAKELIDLAEKQGRILMVGHILHYHPAVIKLRERISAGALGKIQYIYSNRLNIGRLRTEENILWSFAPHDISAILLLVGEEPLKVSSFGGDFLSEQIYDTTLTVLEFGNGIKGHIFVSWLHPFKEQKLVVVGSKGMMVFDDLSEEKLFEYPHKIEWREGKIPVARKADFKIVPVAKKEPLKEELRHFIECVVERKRPATDGQEGLKVLRVLASCEESLASNQVGPARDPGSKYFFHHESSFLDDDVEVGEGTKIWHFSHILSGTKIGKHCNIGQNVMIGPEVVVGDRCKIQNNVSVYKGVTLEDEVFCGPSCVFTNVRYPRAFIDRKDEFLKTTVKKGATIGANAVIVCGVTIGKYALIGASAVVTRDVPDHAIMAGVPARLTGWACYCGLPLEGSARSGKLSCRGCGNRYRLQDGRLLTQENTKKTHGPDSPA